MRIERLVLAILLPVALASDLTSAPVDAQVGTVPKMAELVQKATRITIRVPLPAGKPNSSGTPESAKEVQFKSTDLDDGKIRQLKPLLLRATIGGKSSELRSGFSGRGQIIFADDKGNRWALLYGTNATSWVFHLAEVEDKNGNPQLHLQGYSQFSDSYHLNVWKLPLAEPGIENILPLPP